MEKKIHFISVTIISSLKVTTRDIQEKKKEEEIIYLRILLVRKRSWKR